MTARQIAIDGPAGAGKSSVAKAVADLLGYLYIDTGAMYRAIGLLAIRQNIAFDDAERLTALAESANLRLTPAKGGCSVWLEEEDVSQEIRLPEVGNAASAVSAVPGVRKALVAAQQRMAADQPVVMDGRDIGTVVLPNAGCKIFLTASAYERARRRTLELQAKGLPADLEEILRGIEERDYRDSNRAASPLKMADDAYYLDSSEKDLDTVIREVLQVAEKA